MFEELSGMMGDKLYDIRAAGKNWAGVGKDVERRPQMGLQRPDGLTVSIWVKTESITEASIPPAGLSLYLSADEMTRIGTDGAWFLNHSEPAGGMTLLLLGTERT